MYWGGVYTVHRITSCSVFQASYTHLQNRVPRLPTEHIHTCKFTNKAITLLPVRFLRSTLSAPLGFFLGGGAGVVAVNTSFLTFVFFSQPYLTIGVVGNGSREQYGMRVHRRKCRPPPKIMGPRAFAHLTHAEIHGCFL